MKNNHFNLRQFSRVGKVFKIDVMGNVNEMIDEVLDLNDHNEQSMGTNPAINL